MFHCFLERSLLYSRRIIGRLNCRWRLFLSRKGVSPAHHLIKFLITSVADFDCASAQKSLGCNRDFAIGTMLFVFDYLSSPCRVVVAIRMFHLVKVLLSLITNFFGRCSVVEEPTIPFLSLLLNALLFVVSHRRTLQSRLIYRKHLRVC